MTEQEVFSLPRPSNGCNHQQIPRTRTKRQMHSHSPRSFSQLVLSVCYPHTPLIGDFVRRTYIAQDISYQDMVRGPCDPSTEVFSRPRPSTCSNLNIPMASFLKDAFVLGGTKYISRLPRLLFYFIFALDHAKGTFGFVVVDCSSSSSLLGR